MQCAWAHARVCSCSTRRLVLSTHAARHAGADSRLKLFKADLLQEGCYKDAMQGCSIVFHTASPYSMSAGRCSCLWNFAMALPGISDYEATLPHLTLPTYLQATVRLPRRTWSTLQSRAPRTS